MSKNIVKFWEEHDLAVDARKNGLAGRSRVCARRAAAHLIREYLLENKIDPGLKNGYDLILFMQKESIAPEAVKILHFFSEQVDINHSLPSNIDLVILLFDLAKELNVDISSRQKPIG